MTAHLDLDALADLLAGQGDAAHLAECAGCRSALAELEQADRQVGAQLAALPAPPVPAGAEDRVLAALAAERAAAPAAPAPAPVTVVPASAGSSPARSRRWLPVAGGIAAAAVLVTAALLLRHGGTTGTRTAGSPGGQVARSSTGNAYAKDGKALAAALPGLLKGDAPSAAAGPAGVSAPQSATGTSRTADAADPLAALRGNGLAPCVAALSDPSDPGVPLALDYASFDGQPALVVVFPASAPDKVDVFVVGARCNAQDADVLFFTRLDKP